jgi:hypothetical protein
MTKNGKGRHQGKDARQGRKARWQGQDGKGKMARARWQGMPSRQGIKASARQGRKGRKDARHRHAIGIIIGIGNWHHRHYHRHAIGKASSSSACHHRHAIGIGKACRQGKACHQETQGKDARHAIGIGRTHRQDAGRQNAAEWRSIVIQIWLCCIIQK